MYRNWADGFPQSVDVCAITLPGRETLMGEPPMTGFDSLVNAIMAKIRADLDRPYALFGHSFGAWLAFELVRAVRRANLPLPARLFVSGRRAPWLPAREPPLHVLDNGALIDEVQRRYGGIPPAVLREAELMALLLPTLRADLTALENYSFAFEPPLPCSIVSYGGSSDKMVPLSDLDAWRTATSRDFEARQFAGGHFYLKDYSREALIADMTLKLRGAEYTRA